MHNVFLDQLSFLELVLLLHHEKPNNRCAQAPSCRRFYTTTAKAEHTEREMHTVSPGPPCEE